MDRISQSFFTGINYWASQNAIRMWEDFDPTAIEKDLQALQSCGITHLRIFPLWPVFQPLKALYGPTKVYEYGLGEAPLPDTPAGRAGVSEEACQKFQTFCDLAEKYGMKLIVALITGHMSFRLFTPPAFEGMDVLSDPRVIKWERKFIRYFVGRFRTHPAIAGWDLGNEPNSLPGLEGKHPDTFYVWCAAIADAIRSVDPDHPVISGIDNSSIECAPSNLRDAGDLFDIHTTHPYQIFVTNTEPLCSMKPLCDLPYRCRISEDIAGIPTFVQEFGAIGYANCSQTTEAAFYRASLLTSLAHGFHGTMWWCAFDQGEMDYAPYRWNTIGSNYGVLTKDRQQKPLAKENLRFTELLKKLPNGKLPPHRTDACVIVPRETAEGIGLQNGALRATYMLAKQANLDVRFSYALDPIPDAKLYLFTPLFHHKTITLQRLQELMDKVKNGATLYLSLDSGLMRDLQELTGVQPACRWQVNKALPMEFKGATLPIQTRFFYQIESADAEVLARTDKGDPVFFRYALGKGTVYLLTLPLEQHLSAMPGAFFEEATPPYHKIYRELAQSAGVQRICDSDHPFIRLTEHPVDEKTAYIFAINYSRHKATASLTLAEGWVVSETLYGPQPNDRLELDSCDGALFVVKKA